MKVQDVMTEDVLFCMIGDGLDRAAAIMWEKDCGVVPIVDAEKKVVGMVTDRDICIAVSTQNKTPFEIKVEEFTCRKVVSCLPTDNIKDIFRLMKKNKVKRLPVTSQNGELIGIISLTDILFAAEKNKKLQKRILSTLIEISKPNPILLFED